MRGDGSIKVCHQDPPMYVDWDTKELVYPLFGSRYNNKQLGEPQIKHVKDRERYINLLKF
jgi:hypothetical protein